MTAARRPALDGLRALAALAVFGSHTVLPGTSGGWIGVEMFFVLSGYLITGLLVREWQRTGQLGFGRFYLRRLLRLYPALLTVLALGLPFYRQLGDDGTLAGYGRTVAAAALYVQDFVSGFSGPHGMLAHTWTLAVEEQFYLLWPLLLAFLLRRQLSVVKVALAGCALSLLSTLLFAGHSGFPPIFWLPWTHCVALLGGGVLAMSSRVLPQRWVGALGVLSLLGLGVLTVASHRFTRDHYLVPELALATLLTCGLIASVEQAPVALAARLLSWRPLVRLGVVSYGFYMFNVVIFLLRPHLALGPWLGAAVEFVITLACALATYHLVEKPFLRLRPSDTAAALARPQTDLLVRGR